MASLVHGPCPRITIPWSMSPRPFPEGNNTVVSRRVTRPKLLPPREFWISQPPCLLGGSRLKKSNFCQSPLVIPGLLAGYDAKPIGADLGRDMMVR
ncbi:hypothetical protein CsSME_00043430 [Camellia sinensis var. sinensis]